MVQQHLAEHSALCVMCLTCTAEPALPAAPVPAAAASAPSTRLFTSSVAAMRSSSVKRFRCRRNAPAQHSTAQAGIGRGVRGLAQEVWNGRSCDCCPLRRAPSATAGQGSGPASLTTRTQAGKLHLSTTTLAQLPGMRPGGVHGGVLSPCATHSTPGYTHGPSQILLFSCSSTKLLPAAEQLCVCVHLPSPPLPQVAHSPSTLGHSPAMSVGVRLMECDASSMAHSTWHIDTT